MLPLRVTFYNCLPNLANLGDLCKSGERFKSRPFLNLTPAPPPFPAMNSTPGDIPARRMTYARLPITSAGRFSPLGPVGIIALPLVE